MTASTAAGRRGGDDVLSYPLKIGTSSFVLPLFAQSIYTGGTDAYKGGLLQNIRTFVSKQTTHAVNSGGGGGGNNAVVREEEEGEEEVNGDDDLESPFDDSNGGGSGDDDDEAPVSASKDFIAGTFGGIGGIIAGHPLDTVKVKIQTDPKYSASVFRTFMQILKQDGLVGGLYRGMGSPILGVGLINAVIFGVYGNTLRALNSYRKESGFYKELNARKRQLEGGDKDDEDYDDDDDFEPLYRDIFLAGAVAGGINCVVLTPIERVKCLLQVQNDVLKRHNMQHRTDLIYRGPWDCTKKLWRSGGVKTFFRGNVASIYREVPSYGMYFITYEYLRRQWGDNPLALFMAGGFGGVAAWVVSYPFDVIKSRMQSMPEKPIPGYNAYTGFWDCTKKIYREGGMRIFFKGFNACLIRAFPTNAMTFLVYETAMKML